MEGRTGIFTRIHDLFTAPKAYIPKYISNRTVLRVYDMLWKISRVSPSVREKNREINSRALSKGDVFRAGSFIENQRDWGNIQFGGGKHHNMGYSGCEIIAVYNALLSLGKALSFEEMAGLITAFEEKGAALKGEFGVAPYAVKEYLVNAGYEVEETESAEEHDLCSLGEKSHVFIATVYNNQNNIMEEIHTVCITGRDGAYVVHNDYTRAGNGQQGYRERGGYATLWDAVESIGRDAHSIYVMGIRKPGVMPGKPGAGFGRTDEKEK